jgi:hypothetical protein
LHPVKLLQGTDGRNLGNWKVTAMRLSQYDTYGRIARSQAVAERKWVKRLNNALRKRDSLPEDKLQQDDGSRGIQRSCHNGLTGRCDIKVSRVRSCATARKRSAINGSQKGNREGSNAANLHPSESEVSDDSLKDTDANGEGIRAIHRDHVRAGGSSARSARRVD